MTKNELIKNGFSVITLQAPIAMRRKFVSANKKQLTNNETGGIPIKRKLDFDDKGVNKLNEKQN